jgi:hypothetical protein
LFKKTEFLEMWLGGVAFSQHCSGVTGSSVAKGGPDGVILSEEWGYGWNVLQYQPVGKTERAKERKKIFLG